MSCVISLVFNGEPSPKIKKQLRDFSEDNNCGMAINYNLDYLFWPHKQTKKHYVGVSKLWLCGTKVVSKRNITNVIEKVTCKLCNKLLHKEEDNG